MRDGFFFNIELIKKILFVSIVYFASAKAVAPLSLVESGSVFAIWPPAGVALASLYLFGYRIWPGIFIGALVLNITLTPLSPSLFIAVTNTLGPLFGFWFLQKYAGQNIFNTTKTMVLFFISIFFASLITASGGCFSLWSYGLISEVALIKVWTGWFLGDLIGFLLITSIVDSIRLEPSSFKRLFRLEGVLMLGALTMTNLIIFGPFAFFNLIDYPVIYFLLPPLIWGTLRFGQTVAVISLLIVAIFSIYGTISGYGPFLRDNPNQSLLLLQSYNGVLAVTILLIAAIFHESEQAQKELKKNKENLSHQVEEAVEKNKIQNQHMFQQSRLAQMGEMISMIAHQWRQPLAAISSTAIDLKMQSEFENFNLGKKEDAQKYEAYINNGLDDINKYIQSLTTTIDDFRDFYKPDKQADFAFLRDPIKKSLDIIGPSLKSDCIEVFDTCSICSKNKKMYKNEIMQVILNILQNSQDNFKEKNIKDPKIFISCACNSNNNEAMLKICDNGGGIPEDIILNIFDPYFSTKKDKNGTGLGLYMSKIIIEEHHNGKLIAENTDNGVCFTIELGEI